MAGKFQPLVLAGSIVALAFAHALPDLLGRLVANGLKDRLGQTVIVENRGGAGAQIGYNYVGQSAPDGYTLVFATGSLAQAPFYQDSSLKYDPVKGYTHIIKAFSAPWYLYVNTSLPVKSVRDLVAYGNANPGKLNIGTVGSDIQYNDFLANVGKQWVVVPYKGQAPMLTGLAGNSVQIAFSSYRTGKPNVDAGKARAIAIASSKRSAITPDIATIAESGLFNGMIPDLWFGLSGPAGLPAPIVTRLNKEVNGFLNDPAVRARMTGELYYDIIGGTPEEYVKDVIASLAVYKRLTSIK
jgi:tripartite-type tricarboxylate transporter receptor subunit TctC